MLFPCSFCGIDSDDLDCLYILKGPDDHQICDQCINLCAQIMNDKYLELMRRTGVWSELDITEMMIVEDCNNI